MKESNWPWDGLDAVAREMSRSSNWSALWKFSASNPGFRFDGLHDRYLVPLSNRNTIRKGLSLEGRCVMLLGALIDHRRNGINVSQMERMGFRRWWNEGSIRIFRGSPGKAVPIASEMQSYTLSKSYAEKFTDPSWSIGMFVPNAEGRNGWVIECEMRPRQIYIYNDAGSEQEVVPAERPILIEAFRVKAKRA